MIFTTAEELGLQNFTKRSSELELNDRIFTRGPDFSKTSHHEALEFCQEYPSSACMIVEDKHYLTIWIEKSAKKNQDDLKKVSQSNKEKIVFIDSTFRDICQQELLQLIGPIAVIICTQVVNSNPQISKREFVKALASKIPDYEQAKLFQKRLLE